LVDLAGLVRKAAAQRLQLADGLEAVGHAGGQVRRHRHGYGLGVTVGPVFAVHLGGAGRPAGRAVPAGVDPLLVVGVVVDRVGDVVVGIRLLNDAPQGVHLVGGHQVQAARRRAPAGGQAGEVAGVTGVHVGDALDHRPGGQVVGRVVEV